MIEVSEGYDVFVSVVLEWLQEGLLVELLEALDEREFVSLAKPI